MHIEHARSFTTHGKQGNGASAVIAADYVAKSKPDGQTLVVSFLGMLGTNTVLFDKLPYNPQKDFTSITLIAYQPTIIVGRSALPYKNMKELVEYAKAHPGAINRGSPGAAILSNLAPVAFEQSSGIKTNHIPFSGDAQAIQAMLSESIDIYGTSITSSLPHIKSGKVVALVFGFTQCPAVCPTTLATLAQARKAMGPDAAAVQVVYVTVDPERDTRELLASYVPAFDKRFLGLSGDAAATDRVAREFKVIYQKQPGATPETYTVDHSAGVFVYDPQGRLRQTLTAQTGHYQQGQVWHLQQVQVVQLATSGVATRTVRPSVDLALPLQPR